MPTSHHLGQRATIYQQLISATSHRNAHPAPSYTAVFTAVQPGRKSKPSHQNTTHSETTAHTPAYSNFGRELRPPGSLAHEAAPASREKNQQRIEKLHAAIELARSQIARSFQKQQGYYSLRRLKWAPQIGDKVLRKVHQLSNKADNFNAKLAEKFQGPFTVVKKISPVIFDLKKNNGSIIHHIHGKDLKAYQEGETYLIHQPGY